MEEKRSSKRELPRTEKLQVYSHMNFHIAKDWKLSIGWYIDTPCVAERKRDQEIAFSSPCLRVEL